MQVTLIIRSSLSVLLPAGFAISLCGSFSVVEADSPELILDSGRADLRFDIQPDKRYRSYRSSDLYFWERLGQHRMPESTATVVESEIVSEARAFYTVGTYPDLNYDADTLTNSEETALGTNPNHHDTDGDAVNDDEEVALGTDPLSAVDSDNDGLYDDFEEQVIRADDSDSITGLLNVLPGGDFDQDGRLNSQEQEWGTNPAYAEPNILFIYPEDMGYYTSERELREPNTGITGLSTPNLDALAGEGLNFTRAFCAQSVCSPSKGGIYSGLAAHCNYIWRNTHNTFVFPVPDPLTAEEDPTNLNAGGMHEDLPNLIQMLKANGVYCGLSGKLHVQPSRNFPYDRFGGTEDLQSVIDAAGGRPWFFWSNRNTTHAPFWQHVRPKLADWNDPNSVPSDVDPDAVTMPPYLVDTPAARIDLAQYYSCVQSVDEAVGDLMTKLANSGQESETLVVFSPDHGIPIARGKTSIYPAGTQVPLFLKGPGVQGGRSLTTPVSQIDLNPTFLEAFGITSQTYRHGRSLWPILSGANDAFEDRKTILTETNNRLSSAPPGTGNTLARAVTDGRFYYISNVFQDTWDGTEEAAIYVGSGSGEYGDARTTMNAGYVVYAIDLHDDAVRNKAEQPVPYELLRQLCMSDAPAEELYDLDADPWAVNNLAEDPSYASIKATLRGEMARWRLRTEDFSYSVTEETRRELKWKEYTPAGMADDDFSGDGDLNDQSDWTTLLFGNTATDFALLDGSLDAPAGPRALAQFNAQAASEGGNWFASVETGFFTTGVESGLAFGIQDSGNYYAVLLHDLRDSDKGAYWARFVRYENNVGTTLWQAVAPGRDDSDALFSASTYYRIEVSRDAGSNEYRVVVRRLSDSASLLEVNVTDSVHRGGRFGLTSEVSGASRFQSFKVQLFE